MAERQMIGRAVITAGMLGLAASEVVIATRVLQVSSIEGLRAALLPVGQFIYQLAYDTNGNLGYIGPTGGKVAAEATTEELAEGSFTPLYTNYPQIAGHYGPAPPALRVPVRLIEGQEYEVNRALANSANQATQSQLRAQLGLRPWESIDAQIHEGIPVKFGGSPTDPANKFLLTGSEHQEYTNFWRELQLWVERMNK